MPQCSSSWDSAWGPRCQHGNIQVDIGCRYPASQPHLEAAQCWTPITGWSSQSLIILNVDSGPCQGKNHRYEHLVELGEVDRVVAMDTWRGGWYLGVVDDRVNEKRAAHCTGMHCHLLSWDANWQLLFIKEQYRQVNSQTDEICCNHLVCVVFIEILSLDLSQNHQLSRY